MAATSDDDWRVPTCSRTSRQATRSSSRSSSASARSSLATPPTLVGLPDHSVPRGRHLERSSRPRSGVPGPRRGRPRQARRRSSRPCARTCPRARRAASASAGCPAGPRSRSPGGRVGLAEREQPERGPGAGRAVLDEELHRRAVGDRSHVGRAERRALPGHRLARPRRVRDARRDLRGDRAQLGMPDALPGPRHRRRGEGGRARERGGGHRHGRRSARGPAAGLLPRQDGDDERRRAHGQRRRRHPAPPGPRTPPAEAPVGSGVQRALAGPGTRS